VKPVGQHAGQDAENSIVRNELATAGFLLTARMVNLEASRLFCQLSPEELSALRLIARERGFGAGEKIFEEGDKGDGMYLVRDGLVEISTLVGPNVRRGLSRIAPGDMFGEMAVLDDKPRSARAVALKETAVYFFSREEILALLKRSPMLSHSLLREISLRLREFDRQYLREVLEVERLTVIGRFARTIVRDLKNPLSVLGTIADTVCLAQSTPEARQAARGLICNARQRAGPGPRGGQPLVRGLCHAWQRPRHGPGTVHLQADHRGPSGVDLGPQRAGGRRCFLLRAALAKRQPGGRSQVSRAGVCNGRRSNPKGCIGGV
jgi:CRP-like cAMP-binding protein